MLPPPFVNPTDDQSSQREDDECDAASGSEAEANSEGLEVSFDGPADEATLVPAEKPAGEIGEQTLTDEATIPPNRRSEEEAEDSDVSAEQLIYLARQLGRYELKEGRVERIPW